MKSGPHYYVVVYDAKVKHLPKVLKTLRRYLHWVQNSVFEGPLTLAQYRRLRHELSKLIDPKHDSIIIYRFSLKWHHREVLGKEKGSSDMML